MALGNWATAAVNEKGEPTDGVWTSPMGVVVRVYKDALHVEDAKAWRDGGGYVDPIVMVVREGSVHYMDVSIDAVRCENGIAAIVAQMRYDRPLTAMLALGVYGYAEDGTWIGITSKDVARLAALQSDGYLSECDYGDGNVESSTVYRFDQWLRSIPLDAIRQFSQGDAFFAKHLGYETPTAPVVAKEGA